jgi:hypothetical protein
MLQHIAFPLPGTLELHSTRTRLSQVWPAWAALVDISAGVAIAVNESADRGLIKYLMGQVSQLQRLPVAGCFSSLGSAIRSVQCNYHLYTKMLPAAMATAW